MELTKEVYSSLDKYFSSLVHIGYKSYTQVNELLVLIFIEELLCGPMSQFVTENDYTSIVNSLQCLYGSSCLVPFPDYKKGIADTINNTLHPYRVMESIELRGTENLSLRVQF